MGDAISYFSIIGGIENKIEINYFDNIDYFLENYFVENFTLFEDLIYPSYILETPYRELLVAIARGDGKYFSSIRKAKLSDSVGEAIIEELISKNILYKELSREPPLKIHPKQKLRKDERFYKIQDKLRFKLPFFRFWFGFVISFRKDLIEKRANRFLENFLKHNERLYSLFFEQLCNLIAVENIFKKEKIISRGSYWNIYTEFDILLLDKNKNLFLGECKYKDRKVCKNELSKLKEKAIYSNINAHKYIIFSKSGFSNELLQLKDKNLMLFDLEDLKKEIYLETL